MAFIKHPNTNRGRRGMPKPTLTIGKSGVLGLCKTAVDRWGLRKFSWAGIYYDSEDKTIGIKPNAEEQSGDFKLRDRKGSGLDITARSFLQHFDIDFSETRRYDLECLEDRMFLVARVG